MERIAGIGLLAALCLALQQAPQARDPHPAQRFRAGGEPVVANPDGLIFCEAEEFAIEKPGWEAKPWGQNYYAATFANTFLSRKAFLGAPEQGPETVARVTVAIKDAGRYAVLARYEAAYRFETRFRIQVEQAGRVVMDRLYGARDNVKIWAFSKKLQKEVAWDWGAVENIVWEGHDSFVELQAGVATLRLIAGPQPGHAARRNVDVLLLTRDLEDVRKRIETEAYLPLDGLLTQAGDVWIRVTNPGPSKITVQTLSYHLGPFHEHAPYWVHKRTWKALNVDVPPGAATDWIEAGSTMDALNDGQWGLRSSGPCRLEIGVRSANLRVEKIREFDMKGDLPLVGFADTRYSRQVRPPKELLAELVGELRRVATFGRAPTETPVYATTSLPEIDQLFSLTNTSKPPSGPHGYADWRGQNAAQLEETCRKLDERQKAQMKVVSLGDEILLPEPDPRSATESFSEYLKLQGLLPEELALVAGTDGASPAYNPDPKLRSTWPALYYWSQRYRQHFGIQKMKELTDVLRRHLPNAGIGANFSPHHGGTAHAYLGRVFQWVSCFRASCLTLPWSEDFAWQIPTGTPQMNEISLDLLRAGARGIASAKTIFYVLAHSPGNTPRMWRRQFHAALAHGMKYVDLFEFQPVWAAWSENHVAAPEMYATVLRTLRELGQYEDILQAGQIPWGEVGLWFSETGDIWGDSDGSFGPAKRALYIAVRHGQAPLDVVVEQDSLDGTLGRYKVLYLTDRHVSRRASRAIAEWVRGGGILFATAGAGMLDEYDRPNAALRELLPVDGVTLLAPAPSRVGYIKQDLPFAEPIAKVASWQGTFPVFGAIARLAQAVGTRAGAFGDGGPAVLERVSGRGRVFYCAFLPGLSYFKPAIPLRPVDRGTTDDAMAHFLPVDFDRGVGALVATPLSGLLRPVAAEDKLVEATLIQSSKGVLIPLVNWSDRPKRDLRVTLRTAAPGRSVALASGGRVSERREGTSRVFTLEGLSVADVLILR